MGKLLIYTTQITVRLQYVLDILLKDLLSLDFELTTDDGQFKNYNGPKFSYANAPVGDELFFGTHKLLFEDNIRNQQIVVTQHGNIQGFFPTEGALPFDIFASAFYMVSRYEEYLDEALDKYGRFRASHSINYKSGFLRKPMVNYYALQLKEILQERWPALSIKLPAFKYEATVDVDMAYSYLHKGFKRNLGGIVRSIMFSGFGDLMKRLQVLRGKQKDPFDTYEYIFGLLKQYGIGTQFFILLSNGSRFDKNTPHCKLPFRQLIQEIDGRYPTGIHLSFKSHISDELMKEEIQRMEEITGHEVIHNRFHYLRFNVKKSFSRLIKLGIKHDHSMGYGPHAGFRAGICTPYLYFDLQENAVSALTIHPIAFMDTTFAHYKHYSPAHAQEKINEILSYVKETGGTCIGLWHNSSFTEVEEWKGYRSVFENTMERAAALMETNGANTSTEATGY